MSYPKAEQIVSILNNKRLQRMRWAALRTVLPMLRRNNVRCEWQKYVLTTDDYFNRAAGPHCSLPTRPTTQKRVFWIPRVFFYKIKLFKTRTAAKASCFS